MKKIVRIIVKECLGHKRGEEFLIVCDDKLRALAYDFYKAAGALGIETILLEMAPRKMHGEEPPEIVAASLKRADSAVLLTSMSLSHTKARKVASSECGTKIASLPGVTEKILKRSIPLNYAALRKKAAKVSRLLTKGKRVEIRTKRGTHLIMSIKGRKGFADDGLYARKGAFGNLPAGEACIAPLEGTTNGRLVVDGSAPFTGRVRHPVEMIIKNGYAQDIPFPKLKSLVKSLGKRALNVAEFGIGLNPKARVTGNILEDEKAQKTAHIALGNSRSFGGRVFCPCHLDFIFLRPTILIDGVEL